MAVSKQNLPDWLYDALKANGGKGTIPKLCKYVWDNHEAELRGAGDLFYTWQYDIRWAANELRREGIMKPADLSPRGLWELK